MDYTCLIGGRCFHLSLGQYAGIIFPGLASNGKFSKVNPFALPSIMSKISLIPGSLTGTENYIS